MINFGRIEEGRLVRAPKKLTGVLVEIVNEDGETETVSCTVSNPTAKQYLDAGYLPVGESTAPEAPEGQHYEAGNWTEGNGQIVRTWVLVDDPDPEEEEISAEEALDIIFGGDENAMD